MSVQPGPTEKRYAANGVSLIYTVPFLVIEAGDLQVLLNGSLLTSGFTHVGVGLPISYIEFALPPTGDLLLQISVPFQRLVDYQENGDFLSFTVNRDFDRIWQALKQLLRTTSRSPVLGINDIDGDGWYLAKGNGLRDLHDPEQLQDAATRGWTETYLGSLIGAISGNPSLASGVGYVTPRGALGVVQDMANTADPLKGAGYIARAIRHINSLSELRTVRGQYDGEVIYLRGRTALTPGAGAGVFAWLAASTATDDDGYTIDSTGTGRWIRQDSAAEIDAAWYGASVSSSSAVNTSAIQAAINTATAIGLNTVRLPGKGIIFVGVLTGAAAITFVSNGAFFSDYAYSVEQDVVRKEVAMPAAFSWFPGKVFTGGATGLAKSTVGVASLWKSQEVSGIVNYYVDVVGGSDANNGTTPNAPLKTIVAAIAKPDVGVINVKAGTYYESLGNVIGITVNRDIQIRSWSGGNDVIIRNGVDSSSVTWTIATGVATYQATIGQTIFRVMDKTVVDARGDYLDLKPQTSIADVNANPGSFWYDSATGNVYVRMYTNRTPSGDALLMRANTSLRINGNRAIFLKNLRFEGGTGVNLVNASGVRPRLYALESSFRYSGSNGIDTLGGTSYLERCVIAKAGLDNLNYHDDSGLNSRALEIDVISYGSGDLAAKGYIVLGESQNASSMHDTGSVIRINGSYDESWGPVIPDTGTSSSMNVGVYSGKSLAVTATQNESFYSEGGMYLIDSTAKGSTYDLRTAAGGTLNIRGMTMAGSILREGGGVVQQF